jgi:[protein-PII] uridylyltransferase
LTISTKDHVAAVAVAPYFDPKALRAAFAGVVAANGSDPKTLRAGALALIKPLVVSARQAARAGLDADGNGRRCAAGLSHFQDTLIRAIYDFAVEYVYPAHVPSDAEHMCVVATGGYGRGLLAPGSDIDLLFLLPYKQTAWGESVVEFILYLLWDLGFKVGHATRNVDQCVSLAKSDMTIRTALLDARLIFGDSALFDELEHRFAVEVVKGTGREFVEAKLGERDERYSKSGASRYVVEPNVKDGKGGLRDLHTLHWMLKYLSSASPNERGNAVGVLSRADAATFRRCEDFLWTVRCQLHFLAGRAEERLSFDWQPQVAQQLGYVDRSGLRAVERFMKHYFLVARDVGQIMNTVCAALEMQQLKRTPTLNRLLAPLGWRSRQHLRRTSDFRIENGRINVVDARVFERDPVNLIRLFSRAEKHNVSFHPEAMRLVRQSLRLIDAKFRADKQANALFLELLTTPDNPESALRRMSEAGVLGRFIPEFGHVISMMQFNMYHHYTVDEHLIRTVGKLAQIEKGEASDDLPLSTEIFPTIRNRRALYVAAFLHDIGKGQQEDHSIVGARVARDICPRLGLTQAETELVAWLIEQHLTMSNTAQSRDLSDPKTISDFAAIVQTQERLKLLLLLTCADIRAVGPGTWNGWKGQLLRSLYYESEPLVTGGHSVATSRQRIVRAQDELRAYLKDWPSSEVEAFIGLHYDDYWLRTDARRQQEHAKLVHLARGQEQALATDFHTDAFRAVTELTVLAPNHPRLLSIFAGACAAVGANIVGAHVSTTRDGMALDTFQLERAFDADDDERRRALRISQLIERLLKGEVWFDTLLQNRREVKGRARAFTVEPEVIVSNTKSDRLTILEVSGLDRPGLLYELTSAISDLKLDIWSAHVTTFGEKAVDVFYVTDLTSKKVESASRIGAIEARMTEVLRAEAGG